MRARLLIVLGLGLCSCALEERADFLVGRACDPSSAPACDVGESCLPHAWLSMNMPTSFYCRDKDSFAKLSDNRDPPLAYCDKDHWICPTGTVCNADRVRPLDGGLRREVCQLPGSVFGPPL
ncbi:MAG: hypothetical protein U1E65_05060 [Myxococcota bacterium]